MKARVLRDKVVALVIIVPVILGWFSGCGGDEKHAKTIAYQLCKTCFLLIGDVQQGTPPLEQSEWRKRRSWLAGLNFQGLSAPEKEDLEAFRSALLDFIDCHPKGSQTLLYKVSELIFKCEPILVDFEITGDAARKDGYPADLARRIDALLDLCKASFLMDWGVNIEELEKVRPAARYFVEHHLVFNAMLRGGGRPLPAQVAVLAMRPGQIENLEERRVFEVMYEALLSFSRCVVKRDETCLKTNMMLYLMSVTAIQIRFNVTEKEIGKAVHGPSREVLTKILSVPSPGRP